MTSPREILHTSSVGMQIARSRGMISILLICAVLGVDDPSAALQTPAGYGPTTIGESEARAMADLTRSAGMADLNNSRAANNYEDAWAKELETRRKAVEAYYEIRKLNRDFRAGHAHPPRA